MTFGYGAGMIVTFALAIAFAILGGGLVRTGKGLETGDEVGCFFLGMLFLTFSAIAWWGLFFLYIHRQ